MLADQIEDVRTYLRRKGFEYHPYVDESALDRLDRSTYRHHTTGEVTCPQ